MLENEIQDSRIVDETIAIANYLEVVKQSVIKIGLEYLAPISEEELEARCVAVLNKLLGAAK